MAGWTRVSGLSRALGPGAVACVVVGVGACSLTPVEGRITSAQPTASAGTFGNGEIGIEIGGSGNLPIEIGTGGSDSNPCVPALAQAPVFGDQVFNSAAAARRELYSWTTDEQAAALRKDQVLFVDMSDPSLGRGYAFTAIDQIALNAAAQQPDGGPVPEQAQLATMLSGSLFEKPRYAWPEPWATRMGWPGEDYGGQLLHIMLKAEAWLAIVKNGAITVVDMNNQPVAAADALASPERVGAIFYWRDASSGGAVCGGSFFGGGNGYREFIVGNLGMIEEWSIGTQVIRDRLSANIDQLTEFLTNIRDCPVTTDVTTWNESVVCQWDHIPGPPLAAPEEVIYGQALAIPSENYIAAPLQMATLIETLQGDLFEPDPLVVTPGSP